MDRDEFMELVYETFETFADEPDNVLANGIIEAADAYVEYEKAQLLHEVTTSDLISRQAAIDTLMNSVTPYGFIDADDNIESGCKDKDVVEMLYNLPPAQPEPAIPLSWIEKYIEWLKGFDNEFANLEAAHISVMVKKWRDEQNERTD